MIQLLCNGFHSNQSQFREKGIKLFRNIISAINYLVIQILEDIRDVSQIYFVNPVGTESEKKIRMVKSKLALWRILTITTVCLGNWSGYMNSGYPITFTAFMLLTAFATDLYVISLRITDMLFHKDSYAHKKFGWVGEFVPQWLEDIKKCGPDALENFYKKAKEIDPADKITQYVLDGLFFRRLYLILIRDIKKTIR